MGSCIGALPFAEAAHLCHTMGARLCTAAELAAVPIEGSSSCNADREWGWASTTCVSLQYQLAHLQQNGLSRCFGVDSELVTRCCGDDQAAVQDSGQDSTGASSANSVAAIATTLLLVAMITIFCAIIVIVAVVYRRKKKQVDDDGASSVEIVPKPFEIFMEEKNTLNPLTRDGDLGHTKMSTAITERRNSNDEDKSVLSDELMQAWAAQRKFRAGVQPVWWIAPPPADISIGNPSELDFPTDLEWDGNSMMAGNPHSTPHPLESEQRPSITRTYDNIDDGNMKSEAACTTIAAGEEPLHMGAQEESAHPYEEAASPNCREMSEAGTYAQIESEAPTVSDASTTARQIQFYEKLSSNNSV